MKKIIILFVFNNPLLVIFLAYLYCNITVSLNVKGFFIRKFYFSLINFSKSIKIPRYLHKSIRAILIPFITSWGFTTDIIQKLFFFTQC